MKSLEEMQPAAWDVLTPAERRAVAEDARPTDEVVQKLLPFSVVIHVEWPDTPNSGGWMVAERFSDYVRDRLASEESNS